MTNKLTMKNNNQIKKIQSIPTQLDNKSINKLQFYHQIKSLTKVVNNKMQTNKFNRHKN